MQTEIYKNLSLENLPDENWADIQDYEGYYQVSNMGRIKSLQRMIIDKNGSYRFFWEKILRQSKSRGYLVVGLSIESQNKVKSVHRLVGIHHVPNPENKPEINHKKGIKIDNRATELEWMTHAENSQHAVDSGLTKNEKGAKGGRAKLSEQQVVEIKRLIKVGMKQKTIASMFGVLPTNISAINKKIIWKWLV